MSKPNLTQKQCEAVANVLVLAMCVDGHFSLLEEDKIQEKISSLGWDPDQSPDHHVNLSIARARDVADSPEKTKGYVEQQAEVLGGSEAKTFALEKAVELLNADGLKAEEGTFISLLRGIFKV